ARPRPRRSRHALRGVRAHPLPGALAARRRANERARSCGTEGRRWQPRGGGPRRARGRDRAPRAAALRPWPPGTARGAVAGEPSLSPLRVRRHHLVIVGVLLVAL